MSRERGNLHDSVTAEQVRNLLSYDEASGIFRWKVSRGTAKNGDVAGFVGTGGYIKIRLMGRNYFSHRLAFLFMNGEWPSEEVDHINRVRTDNRWANLRASSRKENMQNKSTYKNKASSNFAGVTWNKRARKWKAQIQIDGEKKGLGYFANEHEAHVAYVNAKRVMHPFAEIR